ncbi:MAG: phosphate ABC transporter substrate-binding protein [Gammaproteobacteria bacterium]|nr:MAG: phosphate ABC transporter substrate-binding protein [Gammaproteobacteria bacterium]
MYKKTLVRIVLAVSLGFVCCWSSASEAKLAVVANVDNPVNSITAEELVSIFLGKSRCLDSGVKVVPLDQIEGETARAEFYNKVIKKSPSQLNSYWSRLIFAGKGRPPYAVSDDQEVLEFVSANRSMIGYVDMSAVDDSVKVILTIN